MSGAEEQARGHVRYEADVIAEKREGERGRPFRAGGGTSHAPPGHVRWPAYPKCVAKLLGWQKPKHLEGIRLHLLHALDEALPEGWVLPNLLCQKSEWENWVSASAGSGAVLREG